MSAVRLRPAIRARNALLSRTMRGWDAAHEYDRRFDGGKWSDAAFERRCEEEVYRVERIIAERFGIDLHELQDAASFAEHLECERYVEALYAR